MSRVEIKFFSISMQLIIIVILVSCDQRLSAKKSKKLGVNTCSRYFSLTKFELIKVLDKLIPTETEVNPCRLNTGRLTVEIITLR